MGLIQDFKRKALCFAIMTRTVEFAALSAYTHRAYPMRNHPAGLHMPQPAETRYQRHGDPKPWMSILAHRALNVLTNVAGFVG